MTSAAEQRRGRLYVVLAAIVWSTAGLLQRELTPNVGVGTQVAGRAVFAVAGLFAYVAIAERGHVVSAFRAIGRGGIAVAVLLAASSGSFIVALNYASVANVLFFVALGPLLAAGMSMLVGEHVSSRTWLAMAIALVGVALMVGGPGRPSALGTTLGLVCTVSFAGAIVITRVLRELSMAPATCLSQVIVLVVAAPFAHPSELDGKDVVLLAGLGIGQIGLGLIFFTLGARLIPAAEVALITLLEIVLGPLWVWISVSEKPSAATLAGGAIVLGAVVFQAVSSPRLEPATPPP
ncbi:MAG TPA: DMT family transporter [Gaiellaceae bacterium]|nr:DMT family transporter [Gaiellaceae bacterium]